MRKKNNKIIAFSLLALCFACLAFGVYALKNATLTTSGTVGFTAHDCLVNVVAEIEGDGVVAGVPNSHGEPSAKRDLIINKAENSNEMLVGGGTQADWNKTAEIAETIWFTDLTDTGAVAEIVMTFTLTNQSAYSVTASIANAEIANVRVGASEEITLEKGAQGVLTATFNLDLNANGEYPEINNLPFEVKLDFRKAGSTGGEEGGDDVVTGDIDFNNLPQSVDEISSQLTNAGFEVNKGDGIIQATKDGYQYMFLQCGSKEEAKQMLEELKKEGMPENYKASTNGVIVWVTDNPNIEIETVKLQTPVSATYNQDTNKLNITAVEKASGYIINLYQGENLVSSQTLTSNEEVVSAIYTLDAGTYDVKAIAVGDGMSTSNSDESGVLTQITVVEETYSSVEYMSMMFESMLKVTRDADGNVVSIVGQKEDSENGMLHMISANDVELTKVENGNSTTFTNPENEMQTFTLNKDADGNVTSIGYDAVGAVGLVSRDEENNCTKITLTMGTAAEGDENEIGYVLVADSGLIIKEVLGGEEVIYAYDKNGNVVKTTMGTNGFIHEYDENGNVTYFEMLYSGRLYYSVVAEYNENNKLTMWEMSDHNNDGSKNYTMKHELTYDSNGDLAKEVITDFGAREHEVQTINYANGKPANGTLYVYSDEGHTNLIKKANLRYEYNIDAENPQAYRQLTAYLNADDQISYINVNIDNGNSSSSYSIEVNYDSRYRDYLIMRDDYVEGTDYYTATASYNEETYELYSKTQTDFYFENGVLNRAYESTKESITNNGDSSLTETQAVWTYYNEDGSVKSKSVNQYEYYENGKQKKSTTTSYDANDNMTTQSIYEYDESGNLIKRTGYGHAGADIKTYSYRKEIEIYEPNNKEQKVLSRTIEIYDEDQNLIASYETEREYVNDGTINFVETKTYYDADGNKMETSVTNYLTSGIQQTIKTLYYNSDSRIINAFTNFVYKPGLSGGYTLTEGVVDEENNRQLSYIAVRHYDNTEGTVTQINKNEFTFVYDDENNSYTKTELRYVGSLTNNNLDNPRLEAKYIYTYVNNVQTKVEGERYNTDGSLSQKYIDSYNLNGYRTNSITEEYNSENVMIRKTTCRFERNGMIDNEVYREVCSYNSEGTLTNRTTQENEYNETNQRILEVHTNYSPEDVILNKYSLSREYNSDYSISKETRTDYNSQDIAFEKQITVYERAENKNTKETKTTYKLVDGKEDLYSISVVNYIDRTQVITYYHSNGSVWYYANSNLDVSGAPTYTNANGETITYDQVGERQ